MKRKIIRGMLLLLGLGLLVCGILNDGAENVLRKATRICAECIGLE